jgi:hypothetical protein
MIELPLGVHAVKSRGKPYFYYHPNRGTAAEGKRVRLPNDPQSAEFWAAYAQLSGLAVSPPTPRAGTFDALIAAYTAGPEFAKKGERTRILNERHLRLIAKAWGSLVVRGLPASPCPGAARQPRRPPAYGRPGCLLAAR